MLRKFRGFRAPPRRLKESPIGRGWLAAFDLPRQLLYFFSMTVLEERRMKVLLKDAVIEVLKERRDLLTEAMRESLEDMAMLRAIQNGEKSRLTSRKKIFQRLGRAA